MKKSVVWLSAVLTSVLLSAGSQALAQAKEQLKGYLQNEELRGMGNLKAYVVVFVYDELFACEGVG